MTILNDSTVVVVTATELKNVLEQNNTYTYIYFGADIALTTGITISSLKSEVVIDGTYQGITHTYTDPKSADSVYTISARSANNQKITIKNINVAGNNYYGIIYVPEDNSLENIVIEYNNLTYVGPQITFHPTGLSRYIDCNITIKTTVSIANEVAECNRIEIGGTTTILHTTTGNSSFWYRGRISPYFKVLKNAKVVMTSENRELFYGITNLNFQILENASMKLTSKWGMGYTTYATQDVLIDTNASFEMIQTGRNLTYATWYTNGKFLMNENSSLVIINQDQTVVSGNYNLCFTSGSASLEINNPKRIVLYNKKTEVIHSNSTIDWSMTYTRLNQWIQAKALDQAGSIDDLPTYSWYKKGALSSLTGKLSSTITSIITNNYTEEELAKLPTLTNFKFQNPVLSIGVLLLTVEPVTTEDLILTGMTAVNATLQISYSNSTVMRTTADHLGSYSQTLLNTLPLGTVITILSNVKNSFLYQVIETIVLAPGELTLVSAPSNIEFNLLPFSKNPLLCPKKSPLIIIVKDTRVHSSNWILTAKIDHDMEATNGKVLSQSLLVIINDQKLILSTTEQVVYQGKSNNGIDQTTTITWKEEEGVVLNLTNQTLENSSQYQCHIIWELNK